MKGWISIENKTQVKAQLYSLRMPFAPYTLRIITIDSNSKTELLQDDLSF